MEIDHIFILTDTPEAAAEELRAFGLREGSNRVHAGQGTANRKFYFENFFLEILWVQNDAEITAEAMRPTGLWQRARHRENDASRFGLCLVNTPATDAVFAAATLYQPTYFPPGLAIDVLPHAHNPSLPWTFRLPFPGKKTASGEPTDHQNGLGELTQAVFGLARYEASDALVQQLASQAQLRFVAAPQNSLTLTFDRHRQQKRRLFESLNLTIRY
ncbi:VOC family protein [Hymenobacter puniceus]|uniref:VOC family protein n=1 Tax=Hymenobacter sp. BT190 TaxID=2763505 RepID=UPI0016519A9B|nr:VOC family protein [Hymenobacter sp. BT190]MBC6700163.1 VOC family protein [Hymenobacter sp. BT190]